MKPHEFIANWRSSTLKESSASQEHFIDLCRLLDEPTPAEADPSGEEHCFGRGARKETGRDGGQNTHGVSHKAPIKSHLPDRSVRALPPETSRQINAKAHRPVKSRVRHQPNDPHIMLTVQSVAGSSGGPGDPEAPTGLRELPGGVLTGFKGSSQRFGMGGACGKACGVDEGVGRPSRLPPSSSTPTSRHGAAALSPWATRRCPWTRRTPASPRRLSPGGEAASRQHTPTCGSRLRGQFPKSVASSCIDVAERGTSVSVERSVGLQLRESPLFSSSYQLGRDDLSRLVADLLVGNTLLLRPDPQSRCGIFEVVPAEAGNRQEQYRRLVLVEEAVDFREIRHQLPP